MVDSKTYDVYLEETTCLLKEYKIFKEKENSFTIVHSYLQKINKLLETDSYFKEKFNKFINLFSTIEEALYCLRKQDSPYNHKCCICGNLALYSVTCYHYLDTCSSDCVIQKRKQSCIQKYGVDSIAKLDKVKEKRKLTALKRYGVPCVLQDKKVHEKAVSTLLERYGCVSPLQSEVFLDKKKQTCLERYGVEHYTQGDDYKEVSKKSCLERYGVEHYTQGDDYKEVSKKSCIERYGVEYYSQTQEYKDKYKQTNLRLYGVEYSFQNKEIQEKIKQTRFLQIEAVEKEFNCTLQKHLIDTYGRAWLKLDISRIIKDKHVYISNEYLSKIREAKENSLILRSAGEMEVSDICKSWGYEVIENSRDILGNKKELDIYIPSKKVAFEYNGLYWHSLELLDNDKNYHLNKLLQCKEKGIKLFFIWEDIWVRKKKIYESYIQRFLGDFQRSITAEDCELLEVPQEEYIKFLKENSLFFEKKSLITLGLYYKGELLQVAGWSKITESKNDFVLDTICNKLNTQVIDGFIKLIKGSKVKTFTFVLDRTFYNEEDFLNVGFSIEEYLPVDFFYYGYTKGRIYRKDINTTTISEYIPHYEENLSEEDNFINNSYIQVYDCGSLLLRYNQ